MKRCKKPLTAIENNIFRRQFPAESKQKVSELKGYFEEDYIKI